MDQGTVWYRFIRGCCRWLIFSALGGIRVHHRQREPLEGALIVAPAHMSFLDPPLVGCSLRRAITFMAKEELFRPMILGPLIRSLGAFPVKRGSGDTEAIRLAIKLLEEGRAVLLFPEGTRGDGVTMGAMTAGVAMLAKKTGAKVLPVGIAGTQKVLPKGQGKPKRHRMTVVLGEPFCYADFAQGVPDKEIRKRFNDELESRLLGACAEAGLELKIAARPKPQATSPDCSPANEA